MVRGLVVCRIIYGPATRWTLKFGVVHSSGLSRINCACRTITDESSVYLFPCDYARLAISYVYNFVEIKKMRAGPIYVRTDIRSRFIYAVHAVSAVFLSRFAGCENDTLYTLLILYAVLVVSHVLERTVCLSGTARGQQAY